MLALSLYFRHRKSAQKTLPTESINHKNTALTLYQDALGSHNVRFSSLSVLETLLVLWQLDVSAMAKHGGVNRAYINFADS